MCVLYALHLCDFQKKISWSLVWKKYVKKLIIPIAGKKLYKMSKTEKLVRNIGAIILTIALTACVVNSFINDYSFSF